MPLILEALRTSAQSLSKDCYVDLRRREVAKLSSKLDSVELGQAHAVISELADAEYHFRLAKNTLLADQYVWGRSPQVRGPDGPANQGGVVYGELGILAAGQIEFEYFLNYDAEPTLAVARTRRAAAREALRPFLAK